MFDTLNRSPLVQKLRQFVTNETRLLISIGLVSGLVLTFLFIADLMIEGEVEAFDRSILMLFRDPANPNQVIGPTWMHEMVRDITSLGSFALLGLIVIGVCSYLLLAHKRIEAAVVAVSAVTGTILSTVLKMSYNRPRPELEVMSHQFTSSFPSGHSLISAVTYLTLGAVLSRFAPTRQQRIFIFSLAVFLTLIVGLSRLYMGVHFPSDILAGWCLGAAWALLWSMVAFQLQSRGAIEKPDEDKHG